MITISVALVLVFTYVSHLIHITFSDTDAILPILHVRNRCGEKLNNMLKIPQLLSRQM